MNDVFDVQITHRVGTQRKFHVRGGLDEFRYHGGRNRLRGWFPPQRRLEHLLDDLGPGVDADVDRGLVSQEASEGRWERWELDGER